MNKNTFTLKNIYMCLGILCFAYTCVLPMDGKPAIKLNPEAVRVLSREAGSGLMEGAGSRMPSLKTTLGYALATGGGLSLGWYGGQFLYHLASYYLIPRTHENRITMLERDLALQTRKIASLQKALAQQQNDEEDGEEE